MHEFSAIDRSLSIQRLLAILVFLLNLVFIAPQSDCVRFGNTFDVSLVGDTVDLPCQVPGKSPNFF